MPPPKHLILLCCHAIYIPDSPTHGLSEKTDWLLAPFQKGESHTFISHLKTSLSLLLADPGDSLLVISGSKTRPEIDLSEAASYLALADENAFFGLLDGHGGEKDLRQRILLEEQALDSFANVVFGLLRFWRETGGWPERVSVVSFAFKRERILVCHLGRALRFPVGRVRFVGLDPGYMVVGSGEEDLERGEEVRKGEKERGFEAWRGDVWGVGGVLRGKREGRNYWGVGQELFVSEEERVRSGLVTRVLEGGEEVLNERKSIRFPWERDG